MMPEGTYSSLPKKLGVHAYIVLHLLQAAFLEGLGPVSMNWLQQNSPDFRIWEIQAAVLKLSDPAQPLVIRVEGGWMLNRQDKSAEPSEKTA